MRNYTVKLYVSLFAKHQIYYDFCWQCEKLVDPDSGIEGQPACDLRAVGKKFDKGFYTTLVSNKYNLLFNVFVLFKSVKICQYWDNVYASLEGKKNVIEKTAGHIRRHAYPHTVLVSLLISSLLKLAVKITLKLFTVRCFWFRENYALAENTF